MQILTGTLPFGDALVFPFEILHFLTIHRCDTIEPEQTVHYPIFIHSILNEWTSKGKEWFSLQFRFVVVPLLLPFCLSYSHDLAKMPSICWMFEVQLLSKVILFTLVSRWLNIRFQLSFFISIFSPISSHTPTDESLRTESIRSSTGISVHLKHL